VTSFDKLAWLVALCVFLLVRGFLHWFDTNVMTCDVRVCGSDHLPLLGGVIAASVFLIGYASVKGSR
jgi:hypothetical protein